MKYILGGYKMKWIPCCLSGAQELYRVKEEGDSHRYYLHLIKLLYRLDQVRITACPRSQYIVGGREGAMVDVRTNNNYN